MQLQCKSCAMLVAQLLHCGGTVVTSAWHKPFDDFIRSEFRYDFGFISAEEVDKTKKPSG